MDEESDIPLLQSDIVIDIQPDYKAKYEKLSTNFTTLITMYKNLAQTTTISHRSRNTHTDCERVSLLMLFLFLTMLIMYAYDNNTFIIISWVIGVILIMLGPEMWYIYLKDQKIYTRSISTMILIYIVLWI